MTLLPGPPIVKKAEQPSDDSAFDPELRPDLTRVLGHYSAVQSINSEDTATWSAFGTTPGRVGPRHSRRRLRFGTPAARMERCPLEDDRAPRR